VEERPFVAALKLSFERVRLLAAPDHSLLSPPAGADDVVIGSCLFFLHPLRHGWKAVPFQNSFPKFDLSALSSLWASHGQALVEIPKFSCSHDRFPLFLAPIQVRAKSPKQKRRTSMKKTIFANRFGLIALMSVSLFASTAFAGNAPAATQVVVTNTAANPVPVTTQKTQFYQATQNLNCINADHVDFTFSVPSGKTLLVRNLNVFGGSYNATDTFGVYIYPDNGATSYLGFSMQPVGGYFGWQDTWALNQQIQMSATQTVQGRIGRWSNNNAPACSFSVTISGELM